MEVLDRELRSTQLKPDFIAKVGEGKDAVIAHMEVQLTAENSNPPIDIRMADYCVAIYKKHRLPVRQALLLLKRTLVGEKFEGYLNAGDLNLQFGVIKMWEEDPEMYLNNLGLLPLSVLAKTNNREQLVYKVERIINQIKDKNERNNQTIYTGIISGIYFDEKFTRRIFKEEGMRESSFYMSILKEGIEEGEKKGKQEGKQEGELNIIRRLVSRKLGIVPTQEMLLLEKLPPSKLEELSDAIFDFSSPSDLQHWLSAQQVH